LNCAPENRRFAAVAGIRAFLIFLCSTIVTHAGTKNPVNDPRIVVEQAYDEAKSRYETNASNADAAWQFARACFDLADIAEKNSRRAAVGKEGVEACRRLLKRDPNVAAGHYYLGMNLGEVAQTKTLGALPLVRQMQEEWEIAVTMDAHLDFAGPDRNLGMLYRDTPGPPLSIGNRAKALQHLVRAVDLNPDYPENHLNLIESQIKWRQFAEAAREDERLLKILPTARKQLTGPHWEGPWRDWQVRQDAIEAKLNQWRNSSDRHREP
jgi:tetratricopeptide (TPR) repeat protein